MTDSASVSSNLASLGAQGWSVTQPPSKYSGMTNPYGLAQSAIPVLLPPTTGTNTISAGGIITLTGVVLQSNYTGGLWIYLQAGDIVGGAAGLYFAQQTSNTTNATFQVYANYQNPANPFVPFIPASPLVPAVGSGASLTDNSGSDRTLLAVNVQGGSLGPNGMLRSTYSFTCSNSANTKAWSEKFGGVIVGSASLTTSATGYYQDSVTNRGVQNAQYNNRGNNPFGANASVSASQFTAVDTSSDKLFTITANIAAAGKATDFMVLERITIEIIPG